MENKLDLEQFDGLYEVTESGEVFSLTGWRGKTKRRMRASLNKYGYLVVRLTLGDHRKNYPVHRLVALSHVDGYADGLQVRHLDGNKLNNHASNLAWGTAKENAEDRERHGTTYRGDGHHSASINEIGARAIKSMLIGGLTQVQISRLTDIPKTIIAEISNGSCWKNIQTAPDLLAALKESRKENEELRGRNDAAISELSKILEWRDYGTLSMRLSKIVNALEGKQ